MEKSPKSPKLLFSFRAFLGFLVFIGLVALYMQRVNMGISIICMVNHTWVAENSKIYKSEMKLSTNLNKQETCHLAQKNSSLTDGQFQWPKKTQGMVLSAFFYGYFLTQIPGGWLSIKIGGIRTFGLSILLGSITTLLIPFASTQNIYVLLGLRFLTGFFHGPVFPSLGTLWSHWVPPNERSRILGLATSGVQFGSIIALPLGGFLCIHGFSGGWPSIFYIYGSIGLIWSILFLIFMSESPKNQKCISNQESCYIIQTTKKSPHKPKSTPWKELFTSKICLSIYLVGFCFNWGGYLYLTQIPTYVRDVLKFDIQSNGILSSIPFIANWVVIFVSSFCADYLITKKILSKLAVRRLFTGLGMYLPAIGLIFLSFVDCSMPYLGVILLTLGLAFNGCAGTGGFFINCHEVGGPFNGILIGIQNMIGTIPGFAGPYVVSLITANQKQEEWKIVLWITSVLYFFGCTVYIIFADVNLQHWAKVDDSKNVKEQINDEELNFKLLDNK
ncbi:unnamed protein product [Brachionus calyciflorus]|uniref:Major facilitator superfamily (MFS) profile domain-containing protein n=1 Tax=Brachionus calyciflorus TaxID=104777 RepID=A0A813WTN3_9BILA|nr:unnamed protein product [Brachionus calyciflorus]